MIVSLAYILLAILALSFLIFIHELGHYYMARRVGMRVETFAIGFGRPIYSWERKGVKWQIGWILFGGYVKIAGQEADNGQSPYEIPDGFFGKKPWDRIKVAFMGPFVNLAFALILFSLLWVDGGREKNFSEFTTKVGWVDPHSELYANGVRPGDEIIQYDNKRFQGAKDHLYAAMTGSSEINVKGYRVDYKTGEKKPFDHKIKAYPHPNSLEKGLLTTGVLQSANYVIYDRLSSKQENPLPEGSPMEGSGIQYGDRLVWVDGEYVYSLQQLNHILNDGRALLTIERNGKTLLKRVPRVRVQELKLDSEIKEELIDWQFEAGLNSLKFPKLYTIPYNLNNECVVENEAKFIDKDNQEEAFPKHPYSNLESPLEPKDKILAVDGVPIEHSYQLLAQLQQHRVNIIVERNKKDFRKASWLDADAEFDKQADWSDLKKIAQSIGTKNVVTTADDFHLLKPVYPKMRSEFALSPEKQSQFAAEMQEQKKQIESIEDPEKRAQAMHLLENREKQLVLGLPGIQDRHVDYNPIPTDLFENVFNEIWNTLTALLSGSLNPKWISGPIGIVQVVHDNWMVSVREGIFWIGAISLNLGVLNLLPIPMLDGGTILFCLLEMVTGRRLSPKTMERLILPFAFLLIAFFVYLTYNDLSRLFSGFFHW